MLYYQGHKNDLRWHITGKAPLMAVFVLRFLVAILMTSNAKEIIVKGLRDTAPLALK
jgi:hypothetical protein